MLNHTKSKIIVNKCNLKTRELSPLRVGSEVIIQGKDKKWNRQGKIVEVLPHRQYRVRLADSGRLALQNRRFLKHCHTILLPKYITPRLSMPTAPLQTPVTPSPVVPAHHKQTPAMPTPVSSDEHQRIIRVRDAVSTPCRAS